MKKLINILIMAVILTILSGIALQAQENAEPSSSNQQYVPYKIKDMHATVMEFGEGNLESIRLDDSGAPRSIWGDLNKGITASDRLERCYQFFELHKELLALDSPREDIVVQIEHEDAIRFFQYFKGIITRNQHTIHFNPENGNEIVGYTASPDPEVKSVDINYTVGKEQAQQIAVAQGQMLHPDLNMSSPREPELQIDRFKDGCKLAWQVVVRTSFGPPSYYYGPPSYYYYIDAHNGEVLKYESTLE